MATSGTFTGARGGSSTGPYLKLSWSLLSQDVANNKSQIRLTLQLVSDYSISFSSSKSGTLEGNSFTYSGGMSGAGTVTVKTLDLWYTHAADGTLTTTVDGSLALNISWGGSNTGTLTVSGSMNPTTIPRASDFTAFSLSNSVLNKDTAVTVNYTLNRKSTSFSQDMTLKYGSTVIKSWNTTGTGALTQTLSTAEVNSIISAMSTVTSGTLTLTMQTKSGTTNIGSLVSRTTSVSLNAAIAPTASALSVSIYGTGRDKTLAKYVQNITKVTASFTRTAGYGASISSSTIVVKRQSDNGDSQTIASNSGTTANAVKLSGTYSVVATVTDSRGRTATVSTTITVVAYSEPSISKFTTARLTSPSTSVSASITASFSMGTDNPTDVTVVGVNNVGTSQSLYTLNDTTTSPINLSQTYTSQSDASAYTYTLTVTDSFGKKATATAKVTTTFVEMTIAKGNGIGVGKVWEKGVLDVGGDAYVSGKVETNRFITTGGRSVINGGVEIKEADPDNEAMYINWDATNRFFMAPKINDVYEWTKEFWFDYGNTEWGTDTNFYIGGTRLYFTANRASGANIEVSSSTGQIYLHYDASNYLRVQSNQQTMVFGSVAWEFTPGTINQTSGNAVFRSATGYCVVKSDGTSADIYLQANSEVRCVAPGTTATYKPCLASAFTVNSKREVKTNIEVSKDGALEKVLNTKVYDYHLVDELGEYEVVSIDEESPAKGERVKVDSKDPNKVKKRKGLILDEVPEELISGKDDDGIDLYAMNALLWQAVQELTAEVQSLKTKVKR